MHATEKFNPATVGWDYLVAFFWGGGDGICYIFIPLLWDEFIKLSLLF